jgi:predicted Zn-dependent peptidase
VTPAPEVVTLPNGLRVVLDRMDAVRSAAFGLWVRNGSRDEDGATNGISHFIEHMLFKGTASRTARDIANAMDAVGGQVNAYTGKDITCFYTRTLDTHLDVALDVIADMFFNSLFDEGEIEKERNVILEEINMNEDSPEDLTHDLLDAAVWPGQPLGMAVLGTRDSISGFRQETFRRYCRRQYRPDNTVLALSGSFERAEALEKIQRRFEGFPQGEPGPAAPAALYRPGLIVREKDLEQLHLALGFPSIPVGSEEAYTLAALNTLFGGGMSSRLFQKIREELGLAYAVYSCNVSFLDAGLFTVYAALAPDQAEYAFHAILQEVRSFLQNPATPALLAQTKEQIKSNYLMSLESTASRMNAVGRSQLMLDKIQTPEEVLGKIEAVTPEGLHALAATLFTLDKLSLAAVGKVDTVDFKRMMPCG